MVLHTPKYTYGLHLLCELYQGNTGGYPLSFPQLQLPPMCLRVHSPVYSLDMRPAPLHGYHSNYGLQLLPIVGY